MKIFLSHIALMIFAIVIPLQSQSSFSSERLKSAIESYVSESIQQDNKITFLQNISDQYFKKSGITANIEANDEMLWANCKINLQFFDGNTLVKNIPLVINIAIYDEIPVLLEGKRAGEILKESDFVLSKEDITKFKKSEILTLQELRGKTLRHSLAKGSIISLNSLSEDNIIKRGSNVVLKVRVGGIEVKTSGVALNDANVGENVRVKREGISKVMQGIASEDGSIIIAER